MKTKYYFQTILLAILACTSFTSCDEWYDNDYLIARDIKGEWAGDFGMNFTYTFSYYGRHYEETFDSYDTDIAFIPDYQGARQGWGRQVDYYQYGPYEKIYHEFDWRVRNEVLEIRYRRQNPGDPFLDTNIYRYELDNLWFTGFFDNTEVPFRLRKLANYNWTPYDNYNYYYYDRNNWYDSWYNHYGPFYAKTRSTSTDSISTINSNILPEYVDYSKIEGGKIISFGNRYTKK